MRITSAAVAVATMAISWARNAATREDHLLPVALDRAHRPPENVVREGAPDRRSRAEIDGADRLVARPARRLLEIDVRQEPSIEGADGVVGTHDDPKSVGAARRARPDRRREDEDEDQ